MKLFIVISLFLLSFIPYNALAEDVLTWDYCLYEARKNHPDLISAEEKVKQEEAAKVITGSTLYPQIDGSIDWSRTKTTTEKDSYSFGVSGTQIIFNASKTANDLKAASENIKASQYNYRFTSSEVRYRLRTAFINLLKTQESVKIAEDIAKIRRDNLVLITLRYEAGIEHKGALLTAEANLTQAKFEIIQAKRELEVNQRELLKEMGRAEFYPVRIKGELKVKVPTKESTDFETLAKNNPSLGKLNAQTNAASFGIKSKEANFFPEITARAGTDKTSARWPPEDDQWNIGFGLSIPIFEGGLRKAEVEKAKALYKQAQADERSKKDSVILALEQTWAAFQDAVDTVNVQKKFLKAAEERAKIAEGQYSLGLIQFDNWIIIEDSLVQAKKTFLNTQANALLAETGWINAKGETLEYED